MAPMISDTIFPSLISKVAPPEYRCYASTINECWENKLAQSRSDAENVLGMKSQYHPLYLSCSVEKIRTLSFNLHPNFLLP